MRWILKKWARYTMLALIAFHLIMVSILDKYRDRDFVTLLVYIAYALFIVVFCWIYYKYPEKFKD
jgi:hypothetical protein